jgi:hypothetical protein
MNLEFDTRHLVDLVMLCIVLEALALAALRRRALHQLLPDLAAGLALALGLRLSIGDVAWPWVWACLAAAGTFHGLQLVRRWRA